MRIRLYSLGQDTAEKLGTSYFPQHGDGTIVLFFDVRLIPDLHDRADFNDRTGTDPEVRDAVIESKIGGGLVVAYKAAILTAIKLAKSNISFTSIRICVMCERGIQRSVAVVEHIAESLRGQHDVSIRHAHLESLDQPAAG
ncbi:hypothetical protein ACFL0L_01110 [Patescibacteria group bacterium]